MVFIISAVGLRDILKIFHGPFISKYPEPVATTLRRAIYYTNVKPDPKLALGYYQKAMAQCKELGLDPYSEQVLGIRIQVSHWLEMVNQHKTAIHVLESVVNDCRCWIDAMEQSVRDGKVDGAGRYTAATEASPSASPAAPPTEGTRASAEEKAGPDAQGETLWRKRQRLLCKAMGSSVKLGELYSNEHVLDPDKSRSHLVWAVETGLREFQRCKTQGLKPGEEDWSSPEEMGAALESLGRDFERRSEFHLAIPLFFHALRLCASPCHRAVIMNNISAAFAQHPIHAPAQLDVAEALQAPVDAAAPKSRSECLDAALNWARNAYGHARDVGGDARTAECDEACAVALCNWGDVAAMLGQVGVARAKYEQCIEMSRDMEFARGLEQAQEGLAKLKPTTSPARS